MGDFSSVPSPVKPHITCFVAFALKKIFYGQRHDKLQKIRVQSCRYNVCVSEQCSMFDIGGEWTHTHALIVLVLQNIHSCRVCVVMFEYIMVQVWVWLYDIIYIYIYDYTCKWQKMSIRVKSNKASGKVSKLLILNIKWKNIFSLFLESCMAVNFI